MSTDTKRQHYVWRAYLRSWSHNDKIFFKRGDIIAKTSLMNVGHRKVFYRLSELSNIEKEFIFDSIHKIAPSDISSLFDDIQFDLELLEFTNSHPESFNQDYIEKDYNNYDQYIERYHGIIENYGKNLIKCRSLFSLNKCVHEEGILNIMIFLFVQYYRTNAIKEAFVNDKVFEADKKILSKTWNILSFCIAIVEAYNSSNKKLRFKFLVNKTKQSFITGDQPIFNHLNTHFKKCSHDVELYYPLSPQYALLVKFNETNGDQISEMVLDEAAVHYFNKKIIDFSSEFIFSNNDESLCVYKE
ncbi:DUF4238 domain-containing protein [Halosquirtibacter xylanolyticus]|uniref:DUF4238 domain-containing protein n=1 Tax=Halosquirtibacter xylanolyticus TaxID=3374599 RepID=UPI003747D56D|nr:DUF4238 domain-containing protein [Prolixibacteraceae bacterium]